MAGLAVAETASYAVETLQKIIELKEKNSQRVLGLKVKAKLANNMLAIMYERPTISIAQATEALGVSVPTTASLVKDLVGIGVLKELTGAQRNRVYEYSEYLDLFRME